MTARKLLPCFIAFLILVSTLNSQSLWWDEGISIHLAESSWKTIIEDRASNIHPPFYFFLLKLWLGVAGSTAFSARYLSVLATTLLPAVLYKLLRHHFNLRSALTGAFMISIAPPFIIYGQEVRAYAFLPLFFLILLWQLWHQEAPGSMLPCSRPKHRGVIMGITEILFVGFHYSGIFAVVFANLYLLFKSVFRKSKSDIQVFIYSSITMLVLAVPWLVFVLYMGMDKVFNQAGIRNPFSSGIPFPYLGKLLAVFNVIGLPEAVSTAHLTRSIALTVALLWVAFLMRTLKPGLKNILALLLIWLLPFTPVPLIWWLSPQAHPRYLLPYFLGGWMVTAVLISHPSVGKVLRITLLAATLVSAVLGLNSYLFDKTYARSDVRSAASAIKELAQPGDIVLIPYTDWSLPQYDTGLAQVIMLPPAQDEESIAGAIDLKHRLQSTNVFLLDYDRKVLDPRGYVRYLLSRQGYLTERSYFHNVFFERYFLSQTFIPSDCHGFSPLCVEGENLCLEGVDVPAQSVSGSMLPIALCWHHGFVEKRYALAFRLYTDSGILVSAGDAQLIDLNLQPSDFWKENGVFHSYHRLPLPLGLLPQYYKLELSLYLQDNPSRSVTLIEYGDKRVAAVEIAQTAPVISPWVDASPDTFRPVITLNPRQPIPGLTLSGTHLDPAMVAPGESIYISLLWYVESEGIPTMSPEIRMIQEGHELGRVKAWGQFGEMPIHRPLIDYVLFPVPMDARSGKAELRLALTDTGPDIPVGSVIVEGLEHIYEIPEKQYSLNAEVPGIATLIGFEYDPELMVKSGEPLTVTLIWQAGDQAAEQDLKVFVHLMNQEGAIIAQDDAKPVHWTRPTTGWLNGEILMDHHPLAWLHTHSGMGDIVIGLYDAVTGMRLLWDNGEDALKLPVRLDIKPEP